LGIRALVSGYAGPVRAKKLLTVLQAFTDDSAAQSGDRRLFLAGFIHTAEGWTAFSDAWATALGEDPSIEYLRMAEANNLRGPFKGWSLAERDAKLWKMAHVVQRFAPMSFEYSVSLRDHDTLVKSTAPYGIGSAHFICIFGAVCAIANHIHGVGINVPIDFIFDEQDGTSDDIALFFSNMKKSLPEGASTLINGNPIFRSDRQVLPLQAADMLAWHIRREHEFGAGPSRSLPLADALRNSKGHLMSRIEESHLRSWNNEFRKMPAIPLLQSKAQWKSIKQEVRRLIAAGIDPSTIQISKREAKRIVREIKNRSRKPGPSSPRRSS
jgi:hypothetical protein